ncbi:hypothetical protein BHM03_00011409 [Ensete ventricosum]|nr:hypothetical protein BHM03_00011409 [Ensete ventricosum]
MTICNVIRARSRVLMSFLWFSISARLGSSTSFNTYGRSLSIRLEWCRGAMRHSSLMSLNAAFVVVTTKSLLYHLGLAPCQLGRHRVSTLSWMRRKVFLVIMDEKEACVSLV